MSRDDVIAYAWVALFTLVTVIPAYIVSGGN